MDQRIVNLGNLQEPGDEGYVAVPVDDQWLITWAKMDTAEQIVLPVPGSDGDNSVQLSVDEIATLHRIAMAGQAR
jgi:hypothetical protein